MAVHRWTSGPVVPVRQSPNKGSYIMSLVIRVKMLQNIDEIVFLMKGGFFYENINFSIKLYLESSKWECIGNGVPPVHWSLVHP